MTTTLSSLVPVDKREWPPPDNKTGVWYGQIWGEACACLCSLCSLASCCCLSLCVLSFLSPISPPWLRIRYLTVQQIDGGEQDVPCLFPRSWIMFPGCWVLDLQPQDTASKKRETKRQSRRQSCLRCEFHKYEYRCLQVPGVAWRGLARHPSRAATGTSRGHLWTLVAIDAYGRLLETTVAAACGPIDLDFRSRWS